MNQEKFTILGGNKDWEDELLAICSPAFFILISDFLSSFPSEAFLSVLTDYLKLLPFNW